MLCLLSMLAQPTERHSILRIGSEPPTKLTRDVPSPLHHEHMIIHAGRVRLYVSRCALQPRAEARRASRQRPVAPRLLGSTDTNARILRGESFRDHYTRTGAARHSRLERAPTMARAGVALLPPVPLPATPSALPRLSVVLDLDETLVYARDGPLAARAHLNAMLRMLADHSCEVCVTLCSVATVHLQRSLHGQQEREHMHRLCCA